MTTTSASLLERLRDGQDSAAWGRVLDLYGPLIRGWAARLEDPDDPLAREWDREHDLHITRKLLERLRSEFEPKTWELFRRFVLDGESAETVAAEQGTTANAVYIAKSRVLARLREEAAGLIG